MSESKDKPQRNTRNNGISKKKYSNNGIINLKNINNENELNISDEEIDYDSVEK